MLDISLGRQAVFAGVGNGTIDGGVASVRLLDARLKVLGITALCHRLEISLK